MLFIFFYTIEKIILGHRKRDRFPSEQGVDATATLSPVHSEVCRIYLLNAISKQICE
jgi:hypothetical protein